MTLAGAPRTAPPMPSAHAARPHTGSTFPRGSASLRFPSRPAAQPPSRPAAQPPSRPAAQPPSRRRAASCAFSRGHTVSGGAYRAGEAGCYVGRCRPCTSTTPVADRRGESSPSFHVKRQRNLGSRQRSRSRAAGASSSRPSCRSCETNEGALRAQLDLRLPYRVPARHRRSLLRMDVRVGQQRQAAAVPHAGSGDVPAPDTRIATAIRVAWSTRPARPEHSDQRRGLGVQDLDPAGWSVPAGALTAVDIPGGARRRQAVAVDRVAEVGVRGTGRRATTSPGQPIALGRRGTARMGGDAAWISGDRAGLSDSGRTLLPRCRGIEWLAPLRVMRGLERYRCGRQRFMAPTRSRPMPCHRREAPCRRVLVLFGFLTGDNS
jgi:hypothetical protein